MYFDMLNCGEWKSGCKCCPEKRALFGNRSKEQFRLKKECFAEIKNLTFVSVSDWLKGLFEESVQKIDELRQFIMEWIFKLSDLFVRRAINNLKS